MICERQSNSHIVSGVEREYVLKNLSVMSVMIK